MNTIRHIVLCLAVSHFFVQAQDYNDLVNQKDHLLKETELLNQALLETSQTKNYTIQVERRDISQKLVLDSLALFP